MTIGFSLYETNTQLEVLATQEQSLRVRLRTASETLLEDWARTLELSLVFVTAHEAMVSLGVMTCADAARRLDEINRLVETLAHLDPTKVFEENAAALAPFRWLPIAATTPATGDTADVVRAVQSLVLHVPDQRLEAARSAAPELAHRCRLTLDGLRGFLARHTHPARDVMAVAGQAYAESRLSVDEVAALLILPVHDAVALLEEHGFRRSVEALRLDPAARKARIAELAKEHRLRSGAPIVDPAWVEREVIASQRIEDIDARPWLRR